VFCNKIVMVIMSQIMRNAVGSIEGGNFCRLPPSRPTENFRCHNIKSFMYFSTLNFRASFSARL